jgi:hypothetical protein
MKVLELRYCRQDVGRDTRRMFRQKLCLAVIKTYLDWKLDEMDIGPGHFIGIRSIRGGHNET